MIELFFLNFAINYIMEPFGITQNIGILKQVSSFRINDMLYTVEYPGYFLSRSTDWCTKHYR